MISRLTTREYLPGVLIIDIAKPKSAGEPLGSSEGNQQLRESQSGPALSSSGQETGSENLIGAQ